MRTCEVDECEKSSRCWGLCQTHYMRKKRRGTTALIGYAAVERHGMWAGSAVGYIGAHHRVRAAKGRACTHACEHCGARAQNWSYDHKDPNEKIQTSGRHKGMPFSTDPVHYLALCLVCHKAVDNPYRK